MSPRTRWYIRWSAPAFPLGLAAVVFALGGNWPAAGVSAGATILAVTSTHSAVLLYRWGFHTGRASAIVDPGLRLDRPNANPWDPFPEWADDHPSI